MNQRETSVLVVDDYADTRGLIRMLLELKGCQVMEAADGLEAVEIASFRKFDFILMDLEMPVMNGFEATRQILSRPEMSGVPVIAFSANCGGDRRDRAAAAGCVECYQKPVDFALIDELVDRYASKP